MSDLLEKEESQEKEPVFEEALAEIDEIVARLESGELPLDQSLEIFQRGMKLVESCGKKLEAVEGKLKVLLAGAEGKFSVEEAE